MSTVLSGGHKPRSGKGWETGWYPRLEDQRLLFQDASAGPSQGWNRTARCSGPGTGWCDRQAGDQAAAAQRRCIAVQRTVIGRARGGQLRPRPPCRPSLEDMAWTAKTAKQSPRSARPQGR